MIEMDNSIKDETKLQQLEFITCYLFIGFIKGIEHMHSKNLIHRDIKIDNMFVTEKDLKPKISDFSIAL